MIERNSRWRWLFLSKGLWNCLITTVLWFAESKGPSDDSLLWIYRQMFLALCFVFGLGYLKVGRDVTQNHGIVRLGILGQLSVAVIAAAHYLAGDLAGPRLYAAGVDLICAVAFGLFLSRYRAGLGFER